MRIMVAQINPTIGDLENNKRRIIQAIQNGRKQKVHIVLFPELALTGYPPQDLLFLPNFIEATEKNLNEIIQATKNIVAIVGAPRQGCLHSKTILYNSAVIIQNQKIIGFQDKVLLPTYDAFNETRYFVPGEKMGVWEIEGKKVGITICEDIWQHSGFLSSTYYERDPISEIKNESLDILLNLSASPYSLKKFDQRVGVCSKVVCSLKCPIIWCNQIGGNDSLIFDGYSLYLKPDGMIQCAKGFTEDEWVIDLDQNSQTSLNAKNPIEDLFKALILGVKDYFFKLNFKKACLGLSGGIDSAVVACIAKEALGTENVVAIYMPSRYSSSESKRDAANLAEKLGIAFEEISIESPFESYLNILNPFFKEKKNGFYRRKFASSYTWDAPNGFL